MQGFAPPVKVTSALSGKHAKCALSLADVACVDKNTMSRGEIQRQEGLGTLSLGYLTVCWPVLLGSCCGPVGGATQG